MHPAIQDPQTHVSRLKPHNQMKPCQFLPSLPFTLPWTLPIMHCCDALQPLMSSPVEHDKLNLTNKRHLRTCQPTMLLYLHLQNYYYYVRLSRLHDTCAL